MGMLSEFREFAVKGNAVDMAVGIIVGGAFGKIVASLVSDIIMPPVGMLLGNVPFSQLNYPLNDKTAINYGTFLGTVLDFVIVAFCMFLAVKQMNRLKTAPPPAEPATKTCPQCLSTIPIKARRCAHCTSPIEN